MSKIIDKAQIYRAKIDAALNALPVDTATQHPDLYQPWEVGHSYAAGDIRRYQGKLYRCLQDHTAQEDWTPDSAVSLWVAVSDPAEEWPEWVQPTGAHDAYIKGAKVSHNGQRYISGVDGNTWEPPIQWTEQQEI